MNKNEEKGRGVKNYDKNEEKGRGSQELWIKIKIKIARKIIDFWRIITAEPINPCEVSRKRDWNLFKVFRNLCNPETAGTEIFISFSKII